MASRERRTLPMTSAVETDIYPQAKIMLCCAETGNDSKRLNALGTAVATGEDRIKVTAH